MFCMSCFIVKDEIFMIFFTNMVQHSFMLVEFVRIQTCPVTVNVLWLFLTVLWVSLQCGIVEFPDHTHL